MADRIEKTVELAAPVERVWRALTNHEEFGAWFRVKLDQPFVPGAVSTGRMTYPGFEHVPWNATVVAMDQPRLFSFTWPHMDEAAKDYAAEPRTLVEFRLEPTEAGTRLTITESGSIGSLSIAVRRTTAPTKEAGLSSFATSRHTSKADPSPIFAALGNRTRLRLLGTLSDGETRSIASLSVQSGITRQAVTKHLRILEEAGLVKSVKEGRESRFGYRPDALVTARSYLDAVSQQWDDALARLRAHVEAPEKTARVPSGAKSER